MTKGFVTIDGPDGRLAVRKDLVALAVPALDPEKKEPIISTYVLVPTKDVVKAPLTEIAAKFDLCILDGMPGDGDRVAVAPGAVVKVTADSSLIGCSTVHLGIPNVVPQFPVRHSPDEVARRLNETEETEVENAPAPSGLIL